MAKFVIEVSNVKRRGPAFVYPGRLVSTVNEKGETVQQVEVAALGILVLDPSEHVDTSIKLTAEQFQKYSYEIEGKTAGKYGCEKELALHATEVETGDRQPITYATAIEMIEQSLNDDEAALKDQAEQADALEKAAKDLDEDEQDEE